jgi:DNA-binding GntR family transcriptional regulator
MDVLAKKILNQIYYKTAAGDFITMDELETEFGMSGSLLRPCLEDLKNEILVVEHEEGFQVSRQGIHYCQRIWG